MAAELANLKGRTFLLGVGAQKAGTTWLHSYFANHPDVFISPVKEMHFFGNRTSTADWPLSMFRKKLKARIADGKKEKTASINTHPALRERIEMQGDMSKYRKFFRKRVKKEPVFGEITPAYCKLPIQELQFIRDKFAKTKVIFLMRNPVDRLWSHMRFSEKFDTLQQLESKIDDVFERQVYLERMDYKSTISNLRTVFDDSELHFEFYENLFSQEGVNGICDFLGVKRHAGNFDKQLNVSVKMPLSPALRSKVATKLRDQYEYVTSAFPDTVPDKWRKDAALISS